MLDKPAGQGGEIQIGERAQRSLENVTALTEVSVRIERV
jgi:hypothetical protein